MIDLNRFLSVLAKKKYGFPFTLGKHSYYSDTLILVRVDALPGLQKREKPPWENDAFSFSSFVMNEIQLYRPKVYSLDDCDEKPCIECGECGGSGLVIEPKCVVHEGFYGINQEIIFKIENLPNLKVFIPNDKEEAGYFTFEGGCGHFMPMIPVDLRDPSREWLEFKPDEIEPVQGG